MRIISLNTWGGRAGKEKLLSFFRTHANTTDIFCLQEIWTEPFPHLEGRLAGGVALNNEQTMVYALQEISATLPNHTAFFRPLLGQNYGLLLFVRKEIRVIEEGEIFVYKQKGFFQKLM